QGNMWEAYQEWRQTPKAQETLTSGLIGSPDKIRTRLREFEATGVDQVISPNQAGRTTHADICASLEMFAREVMPESHARRAERLHELRAVAHEIGGDGAGDLLGRLGFDEVARLHERGDHLLDDLRPFGNDVGPRDGAAEDVLAAEDRLCLLERREVAHGKRRAAGDH